MRKTPIQFLAAHVKGPSGFLAINIVDMALSSEKNSAGLTKPFLQKYIKRATP
jgi:hypothetical protein